MSDVRTSTDTLSQVSESSATRAASPAEGAVDVILKDGGTLRLRPPQFWCTNRAHPRAKIKCKMTKF